MPVTLAFVKLTDKERDMQSLQRGLCAQMNLEGEMYQPRAIFPDSQWITHQAIQHLI